MFLKSDAIVVGWRQVLNTSLALRLYTRRYGQQAAVARGVFRRRRKAEPPSVPDLFQRGEVVLWLGPGRDRAILHEWSLEEPRTGLRSDYALFRAAGGCAAFVAAVTVSSGDRGEHFDALEAALAELDRLGRASSPRRCPDVAGRASSPRRRPDVAGRASSPRRRPDVAGRAGAGRPAFRAARPVLWAFVLQELRRAGFFAPAGSCAVCGSEFGRARGRARGEDLPPERGQAAGIAPGAGGFICRRCREEPDPAGGAEAGPGAFVPLGPEAAAAALFLSDSPPGAAGKLKTSPRASSAIERAVRELAEYHLERALPALSPEKGPRLVEA